MESYREMVCEPNKVTWILKWWEGLLVDVLDKPNVEDIEKENQPMESENAWSWNIRLFHGPLLETAIAISEKKENHKNRQKNQNIPYF